MKTSVKKPSKPQTVETLQKEVERLKGELQKCLEPEPVDPFRYRLVSSDELECRIELAILSLFVPTRTLNKSTGAYQNNYQAWWALREELFEREELQDRWTNPDFRDGASILNDICQATDDPKKAEKLMEKDGDPYEVARRLFGGSHTWAMRKARGVNSLIDTVQVIRKVVEAGPKEEEQFPLTVDELNEMLAVLLIIQACQTLWDNAI